MKTAVNSLNSMKKVPPFSAVLLVLAALFSVAAWRFMDINQTPKRPSHEAIPKRLSASDWSSLGPSYQPRRHEAVAVDGGSGAGDASDSQGVWN